MFDVVRLSLLGCALIPGLAHSVCEPSFESTPRALARAWWPPPSSLPAVASSDLWRHPTLQDGHSLRVHPVTNLNALRKAGFEPESTNVRHDYSQHSAFSTTGRWLISHGNKKRILFDGMQYKPVRAIEREHRMLDWTWDPVDDNLAYYTAPESRSVMRYDVQADTHTPVLTADTVASWTGISTPIALEGNHGQGAASEAGDRMVTKFATGDDAIVVVFNPRTGKRIAHAVFPGLAGRANLDWQALTPSGDKLVILGHFDPLYGTTFGKGKRGAQARVFSVDDFTAASGQLVIGRSSHFDVMRDANGDDFFVIAGSQPPDGWAGKRTAVRGLVQGLYTVNLETLEWTQRLNFRKLFQNGVPAAHVSANPDSTQVLVSFYQGGNENSAQDAQNTPLLLADLSHPRRTEVAWMGWDLAANPGRGNSSQGYLAQPHATLSHNVWFADGQRGTKIVWASDNNHPNQSTGDMVVGEVVCQRDE